MYLRSIDSNWEPSTIIFTSQRCSYRTSRVVRMHVQRNLQLVVRVTHSSPFVMDVGCSSPPSSATHNDAVPCEHEVGELKLHCQQMGRGAIGLYGRQQRASGQVWLTTFMASIHLSSPHVQLLKNENLRPAASTWPATQTNIDKFRGRGIRPIISLCAYCTLLASSA